MAPLSKKDQVHVDQLAASHATGTKHPDDAMLDILMPARGASALQQQVGHAGVAGAVDGEP